MSKSSTGGKFFRRFLGHWLTGLVAPDRRLHNKYTAFRTILQLDGQALDLLADLESHLSGNDPADPYRITLLCEQAIEVAGAMADQLHSMNPPSYRQVVEQCAALSLQILQMQNRVKPNSEPPYRVSLDQAGDYPGLVGGKACNLSIAGRTGVAIPKGFVITANGFHHFIRANNLEGELLHRLQLVHTADHDTIVRITGDLQELILGGEVPEEVVRQIELGVESLQPARLLAVRSSALAEDGQVSFAGQYASELNVPADGVVAAYKTVIAGKYCPRAISYRLGHGLSDMDTAMAVLIIPMIQPQASGVLYTIDPTSSTENDCLGIYAVRGLAEGLVDGSRTPQKYYLPRNQGSPAPHKPSHFDGALLAPSQLQQLKEWGLQLEAHFGCPQDVEWAFEGEALTILQSRRLQQKKDPPPAIVPVVDLANLLYGNLHCAAAGISCGPIYFAKTGEDFRNIPAGSVVFTPTLRPALSQFLDRVAGVIAVSGSRASHFASVARERGIPVLVGSGLDLVAGQVVTVDASSGRIFHGCVNAILQSAKLNPNKAFPRWQYADLLACTTHLSLTAPDGETFLAEQCRSLHDIVRFCHEKSVQEMFFLTGRKGRGLGKARKLVTELPLVMYVLDLESMTSKRNDVTISLEELVSHPMRACWLGMSDARIHWDKNQHHIDWHDFDQVSGGIFSLDSRLLASYAIVSREYLHLNIRFGYHFSIVDAFCGEQPGTNYIKFRFKGGGASHQQQLFRLQFIDRVLNRFCFETATRGNMLDATYTRASFSETELALTRLGMLLAATRLMDVRLTSHAQVVMETERFMKMAGEDN